MKWRVLNDYAAVSDCDRYTVCIVHLGKRKTYEAWRNPVQRGKEYLHSGEQLAVKLKTAKAAQQVCESHARARLPESPQLSAA